MINLSIKEKVKTLLEKYPHLRDSDEKLTANVWFYESQGVDDKFKFLELYASGKLTNAESIRRCRQKIQEECENLRGTLYCKRQLNQDKIKEQLGY
jgi:hypothetical protein